MKIHEYQARDLLKAYQIPVSKGDVLFSTQDAEKLFSQYAKPTCIAKVQVLMGGRGKAGGVKRIGSSQELQAFCGQFLGKPFSTYQSGGEAKTVRSILISEDRKIVEEYYLGVVIDRAHSQPVILFSKEGGVDIEEVAMLRPQAITRIHFSPNHLPTQESIKQKIRVWFTEEVIADQVSSIAEKLARLFVEKDLSVGEINPLALCEGQTVLALDAKIVFDENALFRHPDLVAMKDPDEEDVREKKAKEVGLNYVSMGGNIGCLVNGAGLAMATMDMIKMAGGEPSNFLDVGGGATADQVREGFKIILQDSRVEAILVNIFGGIMKCDVIAEGVIQASREINLKVPLVVRLEGTRVQEGRQLLKNSGLQIISCTTIKEAAQVSVQKAAEYRAQYVHTH